VEIDSPLLISRPVAGHLPFNTYAEIVRALVMSGNWVALPVGDQLLPLPASQTRIYLDSDGRKRIDVADLSLSADEVVHIAINTDAGNGGIGAGVVRRYARSLGLALDQQTYTAGIYRSNGVPPSVLTVDTDKLTQTQAEDTAAAWAAAREGGGVAVLSKLLKFETVAWTPEDAQLLESRQFELSELSMIFGISPSFIGASIGGQNLTYENRTAQQASFLSQSVSGYLQVIEEAFSDLLPEGQYCKFDPDAYLRLTPKEEAELAKLRAETAEIEARTGRPVLAEAA
jgi:HK97 family phage portal protein